MHRKFYKENTEGCIKFENSQPPPSSDGHDFVEITDPDEIRAEVLKKYKTRIFDGQKYIQNFTADVYIRVLDGVYTEQEAFQLEAHLKDLYLDLSNGCWMTAQNTNMNLSLVGVYDLLLKQEIQLELDTYVQDNY